MTNLRRLSSLAVAWLVALAWLAVAPAAPSTDPRVAQLEATYAPIAAAPAGPERTGRACAAWQALRTAVQALPRTAPAGAAISDDAWQGAVTSLGLGVEDLVGACQAPDHKLRRLSGKIESADDILARVGPELQGVIDQARPRQLPPAMKRFQVALARVTDDGHRKQLCTDRKTLVKALGDMKAPAQVDAAKWKDAHARVARNLEQIKQLGCGRKRGSEVELTDAITQVHDGYYELVVLLPPSA